MPAIFSAASKRLRKGSAEVSKAMTTDYKTSYVDVVAPEKTTRKAVFEGRPIEIKF